MQEDSSAIALSISLVCLRCSFDGIANGLTELGKRVLNGGEFEFRSFTVVEFRYSIYVIVNKVCDDTDNVGHVSDSKVWILTGGTCV